MREAEWANVIKECQASGLCAKEWCAAHDIKLSTYRYWKGRLARKEQPQQWAAVKTPEPKREMHEIKLSCGKWIIAVGDGFHAGLLAEVLRVVDTVCC